ncbi:MAG: isoleucine--tRNA ligase [Hadesarchaea archaeon DG-33-1]|nr:MAG: isoleucine--tRNA ligase [Hadesarchaea archaeon DG-33-1]
MIQPVPKTYDAKRSEQEILDWWLSNDIYNKVKRMHAGDRLWFFLDGPPYASGAIHLGTAWNKIIKDAILRYKTMRGFNVRKQPGWDCHGLPIEVKVEEKLGIKSKKDIEQTFGVKKFIDECKQWALDHVALMTKQFKRLGVWMDWDSPYVTFTNDFIESAWWTLKRAYEKGLLRMDLRVIHWCPRCETALAEHEVRGEYHDVRDPSLFARFKLVEKPNEYLLIWTTTPWTLPANVAVCVHPDYPYAKVGVGEDIYILAEALVSDVMGKLGISNYRLMGLTKGKELEGLRYEHPLLEEVPKQQELKQHHRVICGEHVTLEEGTGCVHTAPGHGEEDFLVGAKYELPVFSPVGPDGKFTADAGKYAGLFVKDADHAILDDLKLKGVLLKRDMITHSYPHCWRCQTPLIFRATPQWFLKISQIKPKILEKNAASVRWIPDWVAARYVNGVESVGDWCISRQRYWGIPLPIWTCSSCGSITVVGSLGELSSSSSPALAEVDLHRPQVDEVVLPCPSCRGEMRRVPDVLDVWFDSGVCSWASLGFPKQDELFRGIWPSDFITEGEDQVTKWFYSQQAASVIAFDEVPYKLVLMHGFALDENGRKMSKSLGNVVEPREVIEKYGADVLRFYMLSASAPWDDLRYSWKGVDVVGRMLNVLWNVYVFATTYMALDRFDPTKVDMGRIRDSFLPEDLWLISRINSITGEVTHAFEAFDLHVAARALSTFVLEDLSRWYVRLVRARTWIERDHPIKLAAYITLFQSLHNLLRLLAPFMPYVTEVMYSGLVRAVDERAPESVHMLPWPSVSKAAIDAELERGMSIARAFVDGTAAARQQANLKLRWPIGKAIVRTNSPEARSLLGRLRTLLRSQLNCKELVLLGPNDGVAELRIICNPDVESLTIKFGGMALPIADTLQGMDAARLRTEIKRHGSAGLQLKGQKFRILPEDVRFEEKMPDGFVSASTEFGQVVIDTSLTPELKAECLARELVRRFQTMRKEQDLAMEERVDAIIGTDVDEYLKLLPTQQEYIVREVRIQNLHVSPTAEVGGPGYIKDWNVDGDSFKLLLRRLSGNI